MARIDKRVTEWTRVSPSLGVRIMAVVNIVAALAIVGELVYEYFRYGTGWMENVEGGVAGAWLAMVSVLLTTHELGTFSTRRLVLAFGVCTVMPVMVAVGYFVAGRWLEEGQKRGGRSRPVFCLLRFPISC